MKASIKFRDEQKPLLRAKIPINILSFPFQSAITAGESKELSLNLTTFFDSGPSLKFSYRPNDSQNPFSFIFKTGIGHFGSPTKSPLTMSAEFKLIGNQNPGFFINFKPDFGDFSLKKSHSSEFVKGLGEKLNGSGEDHGYFKGNGFFPSPLDSGVVNGLLKGTEVSARTALPVKDFAAVNFRWGVRIPPGEGKEVGYHHTPGMGIPLLVMNKIGIEHISKAKSIGPKPADIAGVCLGVKKQLEIIQAENGMLSKALSDLRADIAAGKMDFLPYEQGKNFYGANRRTNGDKKSSEMKGLGGKAPNGEGKEEP